MIQPWKLRWVGMSVQLLLLTRIRLSLPHGQVAPPYVLSHNAANTSTVTCIGTISKQNATIIGGVILGVRIGVRADLLSCAGSVPVFSVTFATATHMSMIVCISMRFDKEENEERSVGADMNLCWYSSERRSRYRSRLWCELVSCLSDKWSNWYRLNFKRQWGYHGSV